MILATCKALNSLQMISCLWVVRSVSLAVCIADSKLLETTNHLDKANGCLRFSMKADITIVVVPSLSNGD